VVRRRAGGRGRWRAAPAAEEQTEFSVILKEGGAKKIQVIKVCASSPAWVSRRPRTWSTAPPRPSRRASPRPRPRDQEKLEEQGAVVELK